MRTLLRAIRRKVESPSDDGETPFSFRHEGRTLSDFRLRQKSPGRAESKAGRLSWLARLDGARVKIYECFSEQQAAFIEGLQRTPGLGKYFPACLLRTGPYLFVEWVEGRSVTWDEVSRDERLLDEVTRLQSALHSTAGPGAAESGFDYLEHLRARLRRYKNVLPLDDALRRMDEALDERVPAAGARVSHPDVTAVNLVFEEGTGALKVIDNELLTRSSYYLVDLLNTCRSFGVRKGRTLLAPYLRSYADNGGSLKPLVEHEEFYRALWYLRLVGSFLQAGATERALGLSRDYAKGGSEELRPVIDLVKERFA